MMKTEYPSRKFVEEYEAAFPDEGKVKQMHITTDGTTLSQDEIDDLCRQMIESRKSGRCRTMTAEEIDALSRPHTKRSAKEFLARLDTQDDEKIIHEVEFTPSWIFLLDESDQDD